MNNSLQLTSFPLGRVMRREQCLDVETNPKVSTSLAEINECVALESNKTST